MAVADLLEFFSTNSLSWEQLSKDAESEFMNLHYGLIHVGLPTIVNIGKDILPYIKGDAIPRNYVLCENGDISFADASEDTSEVAKVIEFTGIGNEKVVSGLHTIHGRDKQKKTIVGFKGYLFSSEAFHKQTRRIAQGSKVFSISSKNFVEIFVSIPSKEEQRKIADFLRLLDERIATQRRLIDKLETLIKGIVVSHFNNCKTKKSIAVKDLGEAYSVGNLSKDDLSEYGEQCIIYGELFTTYGCVAREIHSRTNKYNQATLSRSGDLLLPASTTVDAISLIAPTSLQRDGVYVAGDMFGIHISPQFNSEYISYLLNYVYNKTLSKYAQGSTIIHLHYADIKNTTIQVPCLEEQNKCAELMETLQTKLDVAKRLIDCYQLQKSNLLQRMFI